MDEKVEEYPTIEFQRQNLPNNVKNQTNWFVNGFKKIFYIIIFLQFDIIWTFISLAINFNFWEGLIYNLAPDNPRIISYFLLSAIINPLIAIIMSNSNKISTKAVIIAFIPILTIIFAILRL